MAKLTTAERFWAKVNKTSHCWLWTSAVQSGYGVFWLGDGKSVKAHRFSYVLHFGEIPTGMMVCHRCDTPTCIKPDHLFIGTAADNMADRDSKHRQACGDRNGSRSHPEQRPRGAANWMHKNKHLLPRGENHPMAKVSDETAAQIRQLHTSGIGYHLLSKQFGIPKTTIARIVRRKDRFAV